MYKRQAPNEGNDAGTMLLTALGHLWMKGVPLNAQPLLSHLSLIHI